MFTFNIANGVAAFRQALICNLNLWPAMFNLASCLEKLGKLNACIKWLQRCAEKEPTYSPCYMALCNFYLRLGRYEEAVKAMDIGYNLLEKER